MSETADRHRTGRQRLPSAGVLRPWIDSWELSLRAAGCAAKTVLTYTNAATRLAGRLLAADPPVTDWSAVTRKHLERYLVWFLAQGYSKTYANNQYRALQQFWKWYADEEDLPNPMVGMRPPKPSTKVTPVLSNEQLAALIKDAERGRDLESRRDAALLRFFASTGCRLAEAAGLTTAINLRERCAVVTGKGDRQRTVRFDHKCAQAIDRYLRLRARHTMADRPQLWLGSRNRPPMTANGIYQMIARRGARLGIPVHPHMFRHTFSHRWLDAGGAEGDLMELNGWTSPQMLRHYGASARNARARRSYDRIDVMGGL